jgi:hypothetical protein
MKNFVVIAEQDRGKTFFVKNEILKRFSKRKNFIYDINMEYNEFKNEIRFISDKDQFLNDVPCNTNSNVNVIFEEASAFFSKNGSTAKGTIKHICRRFHTKNINVFVFHALDQVPTDILYYIDFIVLFKTKDNKEKIESTFKAFPNIIEAFNDVQEKTKNTFFDRFKKSYADDYSKQFFHYKRIISN